MRSRSATSPPAIRCTGARSAKERMWHAERTRKAGRWWGGGKLRAWFNRLEARAAACVGSTTKTAPPVAVGVQRNPCADLQMRGLRQLFPALQRRHQVFLDLAVACVQLGRPFRIAGIERPVKQLLLNRFLLRLQLLDQRGQAVEFPLLFVAQLLFGCRRSFLARRRGALAV